MRAKTNKETKPCSKRSAHHHVPHVTNHLEAQEGRVQWEADVAAYQKILTRAGPAVEDRKKEK